MQSLHTEVKDLGKLVSTAGEEIRGLTLGEHTHIHRTEPRLRHKNPVSWPWTKKPRPHTLEQKWSFQQKVLEQMNAHTSI